VRCVAEADGPRGIKCPLGAHARRTNPRFADIIGITRLHRMIRRSTSYGPMLPVGVVEDDGADRGIIFVAARRVPGAPVRVREDAMVGRRCVHRRARREGSLTGSNDGSGQFTIPHRLIRRGLTNLPSFVNRGGEYCFIPSLSALRWLSELDNSRAMRS
jgi:deferrochelatase/peroxidase EfeB